MRQKGYLDPRTLAAGIAVGMLAGLATGCGGDAAGPAEPPGPDLTNPRGAMAALEEFYSRRVADEALELFAPAYTFFPARPESIPFLGGGQNSWDLAVETDILNLLLVAERTSWIDQVLLEINTEELVTSADGSTVTVTADVQLELLIGANTLVQSRSTIFLVYERSADGIYLLVEERETLALNPDTGLPYRELTVGELRAQVLETRG